jgi:hypothetical protein
VYLYSYFDCQFVCDKILETCLGYCRRAKHSEVGDILGEELGSSDFMFFKIGI